MKKINFKTVVLTSMLLGLTSIATAAVTPNNHVKNDNVKFESVVENVEKGFGALTIGRTERAYEDNIATIRQLDRDKVDLKGSDIISPEAKVAGLLSKEDTQDTNVNTDLGFLDGKIASLPLIMGNLQDSNFSSSFGFLDNKVASLILMINDTQDANIGFDLGTLGGTLSSALINGKHVNATSLQHRNAIAATGSTLIDSDGFDV